MFHLLLQPRLIQVQVWVEEVLIHSQVTTNHPFPFVFFELQGFKLLPYIGQRPTKISL